MNTHRKIGSGVTATLLLVAALAFAASEEGENRSVPAPQFRVAVFSGLGADPECLSDAVEALKIDSAIDPVIVTAADIVRGELDRCEALVFPGGGGMRQMDNLGALGQEKVLAFVRERGKGVVGLCAGSYMLSDTPDYTCFRLAGLEAIDREHDERGHGLVRFALTPAAIEVFPEFAGMGQAFMQYFEGPVLVAKEGGAPFTPLATMQSDVYLENDAPKGLTPGKTFLAWGEAGKGRVFLSVGHPENTPGLRWMVPRMVRWTLRRELVTYSPSVVRPRRTATESLFDSFLRAKETACFQAIGSSIKNSDPDQKRAAIATLLEIRSWGAKERIAGNLRDRAPSVRLAAANALVELEHTASWRDVQIAAETEPDPNLRQALLRCARALADMTHNR